MSSRALIAVDVALLLPPEIVARAAALSRALAAGRTAPLILDDAHLPHVTLVQQFVGAAHLDGVRAEVDRVAAAQIPVTMRVTGVCRFDSTIMLAIDASPPLRRLHETLMDRLAPLEDATGSEASFYTAGEPARPPDVEWVATYRSRSSYEHFSPHVTLGHGDAPLPVDPFDFVADHLAICHLGRHCTCRRILGEWRFRHPAAGPRT